MRAGRPIGSPENPGKEYVMYDYPTPQLPVASAEEVGIGLALFRAAVLGQSAEEATLSFAKQDILPLTDEGMMIALREPQALRGGIHALGIHSESSDPLYPVVQRIICFLELLKE
jgi:hypothetical protein